MIEKQLKNSQGQEVSPKTSSDTVYKGEEDLTTVLNNLIARENYERGLNSLTYQDGFRPLCISTGSATDFLINGNTISLSNVRIMGVSFTSDGGLVCVQIGILTYCSNTNYMGKIVYRWKHGGFGDYPNWHTLN